MPLHLSELQPAYTPGSAGHGGGRIYEPPRKGSPAKGRILSSSSTSSCSCSLGYFSNLSNTNDTYNTFASNMCMTISFLVTQAIHSSPNQTPYVIYVWDHDSPCFRPLPVPCRSVASHRSAVLMHQTFELNHNHKSVQSLQLD